MPLQERSLARVSPFPEPLLRRLALVVEQCAHSRLCHLLCLSQCHHLLLVLRPFLLPSPEWVVPRRCLLP